MTGEYIRLQGKISMSNSRGRIRENSVNLESMTGYGVGGTRDHRVAEKIRSDLWQSLDKRCNT